MILSIEMDAETERALQAEAALLNESLSVVAAGIVRRKLVSQAGANEPEIEPDTNERVQRFQQIMQEICELNRGKSIPVYTDEEMTREWIYQDHP